MKNHRRLSVGDKVKVYRNLHTRKLSLQCAGIVRAHWYCVLLRDVKFVVRQKGREKVLRERKKNVHAFAVGTIAGVLPITLDKMVRVSYNPFKAGTFLIQKTGEAIYSSPEVWIGAHGAIYAKKEDTN